MMAQLSAMLAAAMALGLACPPAAWRARGEAPATTRCQPVPSAHRIRGVPLAEPRKNWCGPAALAAVLQFHGEKTTAAEIARDIYLPGYRGALNLDLLLWARKRGFEAWAGEGTADRMKQALARERPVICMLRRRGPLADQNHFVIVRGYDDTRSLWFLDNGEGKEDSEAMEAFAREWQECGRWMMVVEGKRSVRPSEGKDESS